MTKKLFVLFLLGAVFSIGNFAWGTDVTPTLIYSNGFENGIGTWSTGGGATITEETTTKRTGSKAIKVAYEGSTSAKNQTQNTGSTISSDAGTYCHIIGWARAESGSATTVQIGFNSSKKSSATTISSSTWDRVSFCGSSVAPSTIIVYKGGAKTAAYFDDIIAYASSSNTTDLNAPTSATGAEATTTSISWTDGEDTKTGDTGIQETLIFHRTDGSVGSNDLSLNNQGVYSTTSTTIGPKVVGNWTLIAEGIAANAGSKAGEYTEGDEYAIVHRDMAYNYSSPTYVVVPASSGFSISYDCNEATSGCPGIAIGQSALPSPLPSAPTKTGYTFGGWYTNEGLTISAVAGASIEENTTLYAKWSANTYDVTLDPDNGNSTQTVVATYHAAMPSTLKAGGDLVAPEYTNYTFGGYFDDHAGNGTQYYTNAVASAHTWDNASAVTLYAKWTQGASIDANEGSANTTYTVIWKASSISVATKPTRSGYTLTGYFTNSSGGTKIADANGKLQKSTSYTDASGNWINAESAPVLYAQWEEYVATETTVVFKASTNDDSGNALADLSNGDVKYVGNGIAKLIAANSVALNTSANKYGYRCDGNRLFVVFKLDKISSLTIKHNANSTGERYMRLYSFSSSKVLSEIASSDWSTKTQKSFTTTNANDTWESGGASAVTTNDAKTTWSYGTKGCLTVTWENLAPGYYVMDGTGSEAYIYSFTVKDMSSLSGTISSSGWNTLSCYYNLDLSSISGGTAYVASTASGSIVTMSSCTDIVVAGTGLMIKGTPEATFTINTTTSDDTFDGDNLLVGLPNGGKVEKNKNNYVFGWEDAADPGFYYINDTEPTLSTGKAYLHTDAALSSEAAGRISLFIEGENNATGVEDLKASEEVKKFFRDGQIYILRDGIIYDALGRIVK